MNKCFHVLGGWSSYGRRIEKKYGKREGQHYVGLELEVSV